MRPDFFLHFGASIILFIAFNHFFGFKKAIVFTLIVQIGKEAFDCIIKGGDNDLADWMGDFLGLSICIVFKKIKFKR